MKIWIVHGSTGEYSDRTDWVVDAWPTEAEAQAKVKELGRLLQESGIARADRWTPKGRQKIEEFKKHDPNFAFDYTGTDWYISECELHETPHSGNSK